MSRNNEKIPNLSWRFNSSISPDQVVQSVQNVIEGQTQGLDEWPSHKDYDYLSLHENKEHSANEMESTFSSIIPETTFYDQVHELALNTTDDSKEKFMDSNQLLVIIGSICLAVIILCLLIIIIYYVKYYRMGFHDMGEAESVNMDQVRKPTSNEKTKIVKK